MSAPDLLGGRRTIRWRFHLWDGREYFLMMTIFQIDPLLDPRWMTFVSDHPSASAFHTVEWLKTIQLTYGYRPIVLTTSSPAEELNDGVALCEVHSWLTGRRMVSVPFSDHCEPLVSNGEAFERMLGFLRDRIRDKSCDYFEIRPLRSDVSGGALPA